MERNIKGLPGYRINEYLLVLNPHEELRNKIRKVQQHFSEEYKTTSALSIKPNIPLVRFTQYEMLEERILSKLKTLAMTSQPFKMELKDYGSFPSHTIFIHVSNGIPVTNLVKNIRSEAGRLMKFDEENKPLFFLEPFIPVGRKLAPWQYEKGWNEYSHKHFTGAFVADSMLLLKRHLGDKGYQIAERLEFQNLLVTTIQQGELFQ